MSELPAETRPARLRVGAQAVEHPGDIAKAIDGAKKDAKKPALLLVSNGEGEVRFVAVPVE